MVILLIILLIALFYYLGRRYGWIETPGDPASSQSSSPYRYQLVPGFFAHDRPSRIPGRAFPDDDGFADDNNDGAAAAAAAGAAEPPPPQTSSIPSLGLIFPHPPPAPLAHYHTRRPGDYFSSHPASRRQPTTQWGALIEHLGLLNRCGGADQREEDTPLLYNSDHNQTVLQSRYKYKLVYIVRAGPSHHAEKEEEVGRREWETHWSRLDGDVSRTWADAGLTDEGGKLAEWVGGVLGWKGQQEEQDGRGRGRGRGRRDRGDGFMTPVVEDEEDDGDGDGSETMVGEDDDDDHDRRREGPVGVMRIGIPPRPSKVYSSPLCRALETTRGMFGDGLGGDAKSSGGYHLHRPPSSQARGNDDDKSPPSMIIKEHLRERHGRKTCDRRSGMSRIATSFPGFEFEPGFAEGDVLWKPDMRESRAAVEARARAILDDVFFGGGQQQQEENPERGEDDSMVVCLTTHAGVIRALCRILGRRPPLWIAPGQVVPMVIRAEQVEVVAPPRPQQADRRDSRAGEWDLEAARGF